MSDNDDTAQASSDDKADENMPSDSQKTKAAAGNADASDAGGTNSASVNADSANSASGATANTSGGSGFPGIPGTTSAGVGGLPGGLPVNTQIKDAVNSSNQAVLSAAGTEGAGIAYQKVSQASAFAVQDGTDYMRNIMTMAATATGVCLQKMIVEKTTTPYSDIITAANKAASDAATTFATIGEKAGTITSQFPSG